MSYNLFYFSIRSFNWFLKIIRLNFNFHLTYGLSIKKKSTLARVSYTASLISSIALHAYLMSARLKDIFEELWENRWFLYTGTYVRDKVLHLRGTNR